MIARRLMRSFRTSLMPNDRQEKECRQSYFSPLSKRLVLGTIIDRQISADSHRPDCGPKLRAGLAIKERLHTETGRCEIRVGPRIRAGAFELPE
jgi:hypothetical protein